MQFLQRFRWLSCFDPVTYCLVFVLLFFGATNVTAQNKAPVADPGPNRTVASGAMVTIDGEGRDNDGTVVSYLWNWTFSLGCAEPPLPAQINSARLSFTAPVLDAGVADVRYCFFLQVTDNEGKASSLGRVEITVVSPIAAPAAKAGDNLVVDPEDTVRLDGSGSTGDPRATLSYVWERTGGTEDETIALNGAATEQASFTADTLAAGADDVTHVFTLTVTDDRKSPAATDIVTVTVVAPFAAPVANAGDDLIVDPGDTVRLDASRSTGDPRATLFYSWERTDGTEGETVALTGATTAQPSFTADSLSTGANDVTHIFRLTVTDDRGSAASIDTVMVTSRCPGCKSGR